MKIKLKQKYVIMYTLIFLITIILLSYIIYKSYGYREENIGNNTYISGNTNNEIKNENVTENIASDDTMQNNTTIEENSDNLEPKVIINTSYIQDEFLIENITLEDAKNIFNEKHAMVVGDSMAEGLDCYNILNKENVVWYRGRRIDTMNVDLESVKAYNPSYLFLAYGANDIKSWTSNFEGWISKYREAIINIQSDLPDTKIIVNSVLPVSDYAKNDDPSFTYQPMYNDALKNLAKELGIQFLENSQYLSDSENSFSADGVHPRVPFFQSWGRHMASYLKSAN